MAIADNEDLLRGPRRVYMHELSLRTGIKTAQWQPMLRNVAQASASLISQGSSYPSEAWTVADLGIQDAGTGLKTRQQALIRPVPKQLDPK